MIETRRARVQALLAFLAALAPRDAAPPRHPVPVRYTEGITHGFLTLHTLDGQLLADGDLFQTTRGEQVTARMELRFRDGSLEDETTVFSQRGHFALIHYRLIQKGPAFPNPSELDVDVPKGSVTARVVDKGKESVSSERLDLPPDLSNGLVVIAIKNLAPGGRAALSMVAAAPKPRLIGLDVVPAGADTYHLGGLARKAAKYVVKVDLRGVAGVVAPLVGKQPPDTAIWITEGEAPTFAMMEGPFYVDGPIWRLELEAPTWGEK
ncbi:MAG TPA: hypothetical protein VFA98_05700 [Thermoanaerobaculia bacterium]|nr:hypothetical protein [Thermoanaerobaculia bacterium]